MRFSMKWILAAMAYVAVAAAAFSRQTWVFADVLWAVSLLAVVFAVLLAVFARGRRQVAAAGFVVASGCFLACVAFDQNAVPTNRLLAAAGINPNATLSVASPLPGYSAQPRVVTRQRPVTETKMTDAGPVSQTRMVEYAVVVPDPNAPTPVATAGYVAPPIAPTAAPMSIATFMSIGDSAKYLYRAGNAVGMMGFGLLGCLVGVVAYRVARREAAHGV